MGLAVAVIGMGISTWITFRPAMGTEKRMLGTWRSSYTDSSGKEHIGHFTLTPDRRQVVDGKTSDRKWYIENNSLYFIGPWYEEAASSLLGQNQKVAFELTFENDDSVQVHLPINGQTFDWQRVSPQAR